MPRPGSGSRPPTTGCAASILADRAYDQAVAIIGPTAELLNNRGYSYMLRGDYPHARTTLLAAAAKDPKNPYIRNNLELLDKSFRSGKAVQ